MEGEEVMEGKDEVKEGMREWERVVKVEMMKERQG